MIKANWSSSSAFNLELALDESRDWIEKVVGVKFPSDFQTSLKDGIFLLKLINQIKPNSVVKINTNPTTDFSKRENLSLFIKAAKALSLRDTQLFESQDLFESVRIRNVVITLYWLGRAARSINTYKGPQLDLLKFQGMNCSACKKAITNNDYLATMTQQYHTSCAVCCNCNCKLDPKKKFYQESNNIWCENCMIGAVDLGSGGKSSNQNNSCGKGLHHGENDCAGCFGSLEKGYVQDDIDKSKKYCTSCICDLCHEPLVGNFQVKDGKKICDSCSCKNCCKSLQDGYFEEGISRYCEPCVKERNNKPKPSCHSGDDGHNHNKPSNSTTTSTSNPTKKSSNGCKICDQSLEKKTKKHGDDRDKFCNPHEKDGCCGKCNKEFNDGPVLNVLDKNFHPNCFSCDKCNKKLTQSDQIKKSPTTGNPLCGPCGSPNNNKSNKNCHDCKKPIGSSSPSVEALDKPYHPECFKCHSCDKNLKEDFQDVDNEPFCQPCAQQLNKYKNKPQSQQQQSPFITSGWKDTDRCIGCTKPLNGEVAKILDTFYHKGCFLCQSKSCNTPLITGYFLHDKKPYCKGCSTKIQETSSDTCMKCNKKVIEGAIVKVGDKVWHKQCFNCTTCSKPIVGEALTKFSKPYCKPCLEMQGKGVNCTKCKSKILNDQVVRLNQMDYCVKCVPSTSPTNSVTHGERLSYGLRVDPRSGKKTENTARD